MSKPKAAAKKAAPKKGASKAAPVKSAKAKPADTVSEEPQPEKQKKKVAADRELNTNDPVTYVLMEEECEMFNKPAGSTIEMLVERVGNNKETLLVGDIAGHGKWRRGSFQDQSKKPGTFH